MSTSIVSFKQSNNMVVTDVTLAPLNPVIFNTAVLPSLNQSRLNVQTHGGKTYLIDTAANSANEITPDTITEYAKAYLVDNDDTALATWAVGVAEQFGLVKGVSMVKNTEPAKYLQLRASAVNVGLPVTDVTVETQNAVIFDTTGIKTISDLTKYDNKYWKLDPANNTAVVVDAKSLAEAAMQDFKESDVATSNTNFAQQFGLVTSITFGTL